jgi:DinB superfamily
MKIPAELAAIYRRDLTRLTQELRAFPDDGSLWRKAPGMNNSAGNLALHLEGNLREYIGRQLGGIAYQRHRDQEFSQAGVRPDELADRIQSVAEIVSGIVAGLTASDLEAMYPGDVIGIPLSKGQTLIQLLAHMNYHLGQIDASRRALAGGGAIEFVGL